MTAAEDLLAAWRAMPIDSPPYLLPPDIRTLEPLDSYRQPFNTLAEYVRSEAIGQDDGRFHLGLLPVPYFGNLAQATVFVLSLNPGLAAVDYLAEETSTGQREALIANLRQEGLDEAYPFRCLDPAFCWTGGFVYWHQKLGPYIRALAASHPTYQDALSQVAKTVCCLELVPYHSSYFTQHQLLETLPSVQLMKRFVHEDLARRAKAGEVDIIVTRQTWAWGLEPSDHIVLFGRYEARGASLTQSNAKALIERRLGIALP